MMRDIFRRGVRMVHRFGPLEDVCDPLGTGHFEPRFPERIQDHNSPPVTVQQHGEHQYREQASCVIKPGGTPASINGPQPDYAQIVGMPVPVGTKRRLGPLKTDK